MAVAERHETRLVFHARPSAYALLASGRVGAKIRRIPRIGWAVSDPVLIRQILGDVRHFTIFEEGGAAHMWKQLIGNEIGWLFTDEGHMDFRLRARGLFTEDNVGRLIEDIFAPGVAKLHERLQAGERVDIADVTRVLAGRVVANFVGVTDTNAATGFGGADAGAADPDEPYRVAYSLMSQLSRLALKTLVSTEGTQEQLDLARSILTQLTDNVERTWDTAGPETLLGRFREAGFSMEETRGLSGIILLAGTETVSASMTRATALLHDTGDMHKLIADPSLVTDATREALRVITPAVVIGRHVAADVEIGGRQLRSGERALLLLYTANNAPGGFDVQRPYVAENRQLWFGGGRHLCLGSPLAKAEIASFLSALVASGRPWRIVDRTYARQSMVPTYSRLEIELV